MEEKQGKFRNLFLYEIDDDDRDYIPELGMGTWAFGGDYWNPAPRDVSRKTVKTALENGIRLFDTAPAYGNGTSEQLLGQTLHRELWKKNPGRRGEVVITTKFYPTLPENVYKGLKRSLGRLLTDYIDVYYLHWPNDKCDLRGIMGELERARNEGLIKAVGVSNFSVRQMEEASRYGRIDYCQTGYSLLWRYPEKEIIPWCMKNDIKVAVYSPLAQGLLKSGHSGAIPILPARDNRRRLVFFRDEKLLSETLISLEEAAEAEGWKLTDAAISWLRHSESLNGILTGFRSTDNVEGLTRSWNRSISDSLLEELDNISELYFHELISANPAVENIWDHRR